MAHPLVKAVIIIFSLSGMIQGLVWTILSSLALCVHEGTIELNYVRDGNHMENLGNAFKVLFFDEKKDQKVGKDEQNVVTYVAMMAILIAYVCLSVSWMLFSIFTYYLARVELLRLAKNALVVHCLLLTLTIALDITFVSMLSVDYQDLETKLKPVNMAAAYLLVASGIMITVAARGYLLFLFNIICLVYSLVIILWDAQREDTEESFRRSTMEENRPRQRSLIEAYNEDPVAARWGKPYASRPYANEAFDHHQNDPYDSYEMGAHQHYRPEMLAKPIEPPRVPVQPAQYMAPHKVVKPPPPMPPPKPMKPQGKKGPPIPFPDYPQPPSPKNLRSVIKPHSSYM